MSSTEPALPEVMGVHEISAYAKVAKSTVIHWRNRHSDFPKPLASLRMGDVYTTSLVLSYLNRHGYPRNGE